MSDDQVDELVDASFEIVYADAAVASGETAAQYRAAGADGIVFVIVRHTDGSIAKHKGESDYEYRGIRKPGAWTSDENYADLKSRLDELSNLLAPPADDLSILQARRRHGIPD